MATRDINPGDPIIEVPCSVLITVKTVDDHLGGLLSASGWPLSEHAVLAVFLCLHRHAKGFWAPYLELMPMDFDTVAVAFPEHLLDLLPSSARKTARKQRATITSDEIAAKKLLPDVDLSSFEWAWLAVNTRCVTLHTDRPRKKRPGEPTIALAPFLDLLNHHSEANVHPHLDKTSNVYRITAKTRIPAGTEAFISYGVHDNVFLLSEYGFVVQNNPNDGIPMDEHLLKFSPKLGSPAASTWAHVKTILEASLISHDDGLILRKGEMDYTVINSLRLYAAVTSVDFKRDVQRWKLVLNGAQSVISEENELRAKALLLMALEVERKEIESKLSRLTDNSDIKIAFIREIWLSRRRIMEEILGSQST